MKKSSRNLNKYEKAYFKKIRKYQKNRKIKKSLGGLIIFNYLKTKKKISHFILDKKNLFKVKKRRVKKNIKSIQNINFENKEINNVSVDHMHINNTEDIKTPINLISHDLDKKIKLPKPIKNKKINSIKSINLISKAKKKKIKIEKENKKTLFFVGIKKMILKFIKKIFVAPVVLLKNMKKIVKRKVKNKIVKSRRVVVGDKKTKVKIKRKKKRGFWFFIKIIIGIIIVGALLSFAGLFALFSSLEIPNVENFDKRKISNSTKIYDKTGEILLYDIHENIQRTVVKSDKISQNIKNAIVAIEDHNFYEHNGVVWKSTIRAIIKTILSKAGISSSGSQGGSTLTQQMVKNTLLTREKTITRKMKEWVLAYKIEEKLSKDEILTIYLNEAPYGGTIYGIQEASRVFFGKTAAEVSIAEAAYLASIPNLPTFFSPYGSHKEELKERQKTVLREMKNYKYISDSEYREALEEKVNFLPKEENYAKALHFVQYIRLLLEEKYGVDVVENGGLRVITTLDYKLQQKAEKIIKKHIEDIEEEMDASNAALVSIEVDTGNIITMVGSRDYFETDGFDGNFNVATSPRQPGSSFKPFAYATAFEKGYLPETAIFDVPTQFNSRCEAGDKTNKNHCYAPRNWDGRFKGGLILREALAQSRNIPAIKVLYLAGINKVINKAREMGITSLNQKSSYYGLGLVLGGGEVSLLEMVSAYTTFPNRGKHNKVNAILEITDVDGKVIEKYQKNEKRIFPSNVANMISSILSDNVARTPLYGARSGLYFGNKDVAGKTGTTNDKRDAWMIGYSTDVAVGVWTGNNDNSPMKKGSKLSIQPWHDFMKIILDEYDYGNFEDYSIPDNFLELPAMIRGDWKGGDTYIIDSVSGKLASEFTPEETKIRVTNFDPHTILHTINKSKPYIKGTSYGDDQYKNWEYGVVGYADAYYRSMYNPDFVIPIEYDDVHGPSGIIQSGNFDYEIDDLLDLYGVEDNINVSLDFEDISKEEIKEIRYYVNGAFIGSLSDKPFIFNFTTEDISYLGRDNVLRVLVENKNGEKLAKEKHFSVDVPEETISENTEVAVVEE